MKDEMKNRISLALKDPILQQGFEIICKENAELEYKVTHRNCLDCSNHSSNLRMRNLDLEKENADLEEKISILLSCKNCPENKGGLLCQKEYEDKCLAQKIEFIKELQEENAELKEANIELQKAVQQREQRGLEVQEDLLKENAELKEKLKPENCLKLLAKEGYVKFTSDPLTKAKELLKWWVSHCGNHDLYYAKKTGQFLKELEK